LLLAQIILELLFLIFLCSFSFIHRIPLKGHFSIRNKDDDKSVRKN
jgi:hypothetical protein